MMRVCCCTKVHNLLINSPVDTHLVCLQLLCQEIGAGINIITWCKQGLTGRKVSEVVSQHPFQRSVWAHLHLDALGDGFPEEGIHQWDVPLLLLSLLVR